MTLTAKRSILVIEDGPDIAAMAAANLRGAGYAAETAAEGETEMAAIAENTYDAVILDLLLPGTTIWKSAADCAPAPLYPDYRRKFKSSRQLRKLVNARRFRLNAVITNLNHALPLVYFQRGSMAGLKYAISSRLRPFCLARYKASSATRIIVGNESIAVTRRVQTPIDIVVGIVWP